MRPLIHLGTGPDSLDYNLYSENQALYNKLYDRGEQILEDAKKTFMGNYYNNPPKPTLTELQIKFDNQITRKEKLVKLNAPKEMLEAADSEAVALYRDIQNKNYGSMSDPVYKKYLDSYYAKENEWHNSKEKEKISNEIYAYNETQYYKFKRAKQ
jgi:hypothetical protein